MSGDSRQYSAHTRDAVFGWIIERSCCSQFVLTIAVNHSV